MSTAAQLRPRGKSEWQAASKAAPCPICERDHNCKIAVNGSACWCSRVQSANAQNAGGQWLHFIDGPDCERSAQSDYRSPVKRPPAPRPISKPLAKLQPLAYYIAKAAEPCHLRHLSRWAELWATPEDVLVKLGAVAYPTKITLPEVDPDDPGSVLTLVSRMTTGAKRWLAAKDRSRGTVSSGIPKGESWLTIIIEGGSCFAAAKASGADPVSRSTRDLDLARFSNYLAKVPPHHPVLLLVENDQVKPNLTCSNVEWMHHLISQAKVRAEKLATALGRPILVNTPPVEWNAKPINDYADLWRAATTGHGHTMTEDERHAIGREICEELISTAEEVLPSEESMAAYRETHVEEFEERLLTEAELDRHEAIEQGDGIDVDYEQSGSCSFNSSFNRRTKDNDGTDFLFCFLSCKSWKCTACRRRKLKPEWTIHLSHQVKLCPTIYRKSLSSESELEVRTKLAKYKKQVSRAKGQYALIIRSELDAVIYATVPLKGLCMRYSCRSHRDDFDRMLKMLCLDVRSIEMKGGKPITTSRAWSRSETLESGHVEFKITRIGEVASDHNKPLWITTLPTEGIAKQLGAIIKANVRIEDRDARTEFIAFAQPSGCVVVLSSRPITNSSQQMDASDAATIAKGALRAASGRDGEGWRDAMKVSPKWTPKATKGWRPLNIDQSPAAAVSAARKVGAHPREIQYKAIDSALAGAAVRFHDSQHERQEKFLSLLCSEEEMHADS